MDDSTPKPAPVKQAAKPAAKPAAEKPIEKPVEKPAEKPVEKPEDKPADQKPEDQVRPVKAADLRGAYEGLKKKVREEYEPKLAQLEAKVREFESRKPEETAVLAEELKSAKQRRDELEAEIKFVNYEKSAEFRDTYQKPYHEAWQKAMADLSELTITDDDGNTRAASPNDLAILANMKLGEARVKAREMFGDAADDIMIHRKIIRDLSDKQAKALEDAKKNAVEREKSEQANRQIQHQEKIRLWQEQNQQLAKKYPNWFGEVEGDAEGNTLLKKGFTLADLHFAGPQGMKPEDIEMLPPKFRDAIKAKGHLTVQEGVALDALLRNKIASHSRLALHLKTARERIKELEKTIEEYEKSEPPAGSGGSGRSGGSSSGMLDAEAELDALDRKFA